MGAGEFTSPGTHSQGTLSQGTQSQGTFSQGIHWVVGDEIGHDDAGQEEEIPGYEPEE